MPTRILGVTDKPSRNPEMSSIECSGQSEALPSDYESCGTCGFDHAYEPTEAQAVHDNLDRQDIDSHERF